jgi:hypothetical protein
LTQTVETIRLKPETLLAFHDYIGHAQIAIVQAWSSELPFLWSDREAERAKKVNKGDVISQYWEGKHPIGVPDGMIHDWVGAIRIGCASLDQVLSLLQDYDNHKRVYAPDVVDSALLSRNGDDFQIFLRLRKKKIITVILDTDHDVHYGRVDPNRAYCRSFTTRIAEVDDAGKPTEKISPPDSGYGFLWRLNSYWSLEQRDGGVIVECRAISLTRNIPKAVKWIVEPMVDKLPRESLRSTLEATRRALSNLPVATAPASPE